MLKRPILSYRSLLAYALTTCVVVYCLSVLYLVHTAWDLGIRGLFSSSRTVATDARGVSIGWSEDAVVASGEGPKPGDLLQTVGGRPIPTAIHLVQIVSQLAEPTIPASPVANIDALAALPAGVDVAELDGFRWLRVTYLSAAAGSVQSAWLQLHGSSANAVWLSSAWFVLEMVIFGIGAVVVWRRPGDASAVLFFLLCADNAATFMGAFHWPLMLGSKWLVYPFVFSAILFAPMTLHFFAMFPRPLWVIRAWPRLSTAVLYIGPAIWAPFLFYQIYEIDRLYFDVDAAAKLSDVLGRISGSIYTYLAASVGMYLVGFGVLVYRIWRGRTAQERQQVQGLFSAVMLTTGPVGYLLYTALVDRAEFAFGPVPKLMMYLTSLIFTISYGLSITRYKLLPMGRFINRGLLYVGLSSVATMLFCAMVGLTTALVSQLIFRWDHALMAGLTSMTIVIFLGWIRDRFQKSLDRSFYREKYRLDKAVRQLGAAVDRLAPAVDWLPDKRPSLAGLTKEMSHTAELPAATPGPLYDVFISYSRKDEEAAKHLYKCLTEPPFELKVFIDKQAIDIGAAWQQEIFDALENCRSTAVLYSPDFLQSKVCKEEFNIAWMRRRETDAPMFPLLVREVALPSYMRLVNYVDCRTSDTAKIADAATTVAKNLKGAVR